MKAAQIWTGALLSIGLPLVVAVSGGCQHKADGGVPMSNSVTDISASPAYSPSPSFAAAPAQPIYDSAPTVASSMTPASSANQTAMGGGAYTVKKGDTLYGIARTHYGDGKQWQKIASANPGLSPSSLKVGQTITLP